MHKLDPEIDLSNIDDPFYNDICKLYTTDVNTDMTLNDRRNEFYVNKSLCENNCKLIQVINKDRETVKSICECDIKYSYTQNLNAGIKDDIPLISSYNIKSFVCINETFNSINISHKLSYRDCIVKPASRSFRSRGPFPSYTRIRTLLCRVEGSISSFTFLVLFLQRFRHRFDSSQTVDPYDLVFVCF